MRHHRVKHRRDRSEAARHEALIREIDHAAQTPAKADTKPAGNLPADSAATLKQASDSRQ